MNYVFLFLVLSIFETVSNGSVIRNLSEAKTKRAQYGYGAITFPSNYGQTYPYAPTYANGQILSNGITYNGLLNGYGLTYINGQAYSNGRVYSNSQTSNGQNYYNPNGITYLNGQYYLNSVLNSG